MSEKWRVWCIQESTWVEIWANSEPNACPNNANHEINVNSWQNITPYLDANNTLKINSNGNLESSNAIKIKDITLDASGSTPIVITENGDEQSLISSPSQPAGEHLQFLGPYTITATSYKPIIEVDVVLPKNEYLVMWSFNYKFDIWTSLLTRFYRNNEIFSDTELRGSNISTSAGGQDVFYIDKEQTLTFRVDMMVYNKQREPKITNINFYIYPRVLSF